VDLRQPQRQVGAAVLLLRARRGGLMAWGRYRGRGGCGEVPNLYRGEARVGSWALELAHEAIYEWG
jgi:hypothetical protein